MTCRVAEHLPRLVYSSGVKWWRWPAIHQRVTATTYNVWTLDMLTEAVVEHTTGPAMSRSSIHRTLQRNDLQPHRHQMWLHSRDPYFREKVNTLVDLYLHPPKGAVVVCVDEKTGMQVLERKTPTRPARPGEAARLEHEYIRYGTRSLFAAFNIRTGQVTAQCRKGRKASDLLAFMDHLAAVYPGKRILIIWDNLNIHYDGPHQRWTRFNQRHQGRFEFYYTPLHASWVNQIEIFFSILHRRCLRYSDFSSATEVEEHVLSFIQQWNNDEGHPFDWTFGGYPMQSQPKEAGYMTDSVDRDSEHCSLVVDLNVALNTREHSLVLVRT